jgi:glyoxylase-like metal-dependent hydrolase (beta-lactamase superfamily II)
MTRAMLLATLIASGLLAIAVKAQQSANGPGPGANPFGPVQPPEKVADNLYLIKGGGANSAVFVRKDGVLLVDTKLPDAGPALLDAIRKVADKPITHIIDTHHHPDHTFGNPFFAGTFPNVEIIAQENAKPAMQRLPVFQSDAGKKGLPSRTFKDRMTLFSGAEAVDLFYFGRAHTNNDLIVRFRAARVAEVGDIMPLKGAAPLVDERGGGSALDYGQTIAKAVRSVHDVDRVITGHGDMLSRNPKDNVASWQDFVEYGEFCRAFVTQARASIAAGQSADQALAEFKKKYPSANLNPPRPAGFPEHPAGNFNIIYSELGK